MMSALGRDLSQPTQQIMTSCQIVLKVKNLYQALLFWRAPTGKGDRVCLQQGTSVWLSWQYTMLACNTFPKQYMGKKKKEKVIGLAG